MSEVQSELHDLTRHIRRLVAIDEADDALGYPAWDAMPVAQLAPRAAADTTQTAPRPTQRRPPARPAVRPVAAQAAPRPPAPVATIPSAPLATREARPSLQALQTELGDCTRCKLAGAGRRQIVFGEGDPNADLLFAGEGPGFHEDRLGRPFVGAAGELLDKMIGAMGLSRERVYICNVVKCRPPNNRDPESDEIMACQPFLEAQVRSVQPQVIVTLGRFASQCLTGTTGSMSRMRGHFHDFIGIPLMPTYHPAYLLRTPADKRKAWSDLKQVMSKLGLQPPRR